MPQDPHTRRRRKPWTKPTAPGSCPPTVATEPQSQGLLPLDPSFALPGVPSPWLFKGLSFPICGMGRAKTLCLHITVWISGENVCRALSPCPELGAVTRVPQFAGLQSHGPSALGS